MVEHKICEPKAKFNLWTFLTGHPMESSLGIVIIFMLVEVAGGILSNSLALLSDAGHMLVDALALGLSMFAMAIAKRPPTPSRTYGYHRVEIVAALANGVTLVLLSGFILYEALQRFASPPEVKAPLMLVVAVIGLLANLAGIYLLEGGSHRSLNMKAAFWHIIGDAVSSVGVIAAGVIIQVTGWRIADPIVAVLICAVILWGAVRVVRESLNILLEAVPKNIQIDKVVEEIKGIPGVEDVHDIHVWTITSGVNLLSAHLLIGDQMVSKSAEVVARVNEELAKHFHINHTTLQLECVTCATGLICDMNDIKNGDEHAHNHAHTH
jgi:cobalt-zinc-cadmium efflux system protein